MIKLIVSDLDGTLLGFDRKIREEDKQAVQAAIEHNIDFAVASGRMDIEILEVLKEIEQKAHRVSQNGAYIYTKDDLSLHSTVFDAEIARLIYKEASQLEAIVMVCNENTNFVERKTEQVEKLRSRMFHDIIEAPNMFEAIGTTIFPSKITVLAENDVIVSFQKHISEKLELYVDTFISEPRCLDIMPKNISKGNAVLSLINHLNVKNEEIACFGDSFNDLPMFRLTPYSFAMSHAHPDVKKEARFIVDSVSEAVQIILSKINHQ
jgi:Cof subfamily protein (haloacid dehalogenase superfamily)